MVLCLQVGNYWYLIFDLIFSYLHPKCTTTIFIFIFIFFKKKKRNKISERRNKIKEIKEKRTDWESPSAVATKRSFSCLSSESFSLSLLFSFSSLEYMNRERNFASVFVVEFEFELIFEVEIFWSKELAGVENKQLFDKSFWEASPSISFSIFSSPFSSILPIFYLFIYLFVEI